MKKKMHKKKIGALMLIPVKKKKSACTLCLALKSEDHTGVMGASDPAALANSNKACRAKAVVDKLVSYYEIYVCVV